jgi:hypothetical protein
MRPAVERLLDEREAAGFQRHVEDEGVLGQIAQLLNAANAEKGNAPDRGRCPDVLTVTTSRPTRLERGSRG